MKTISGILTKAFVVIMIASFPFQAALSQEMVDRVVAVVNEDVITLSELRQMALSLNPTSTQPLNDRELLDKMIEQKLFEQEAQKRGITVSEAELDASIDGVKMRYNLNDAQMEEVLRRQGLTPEGFREQWRAQTLGNKLLESQLKNKIVVTDVEIRRYYERNYLGDGTANTDQEEQVRIAHIMISYKTQDAEQVAKQVADLAKSGEDFDNLAEKFSDDASSAD
ncbi:MAG: SurA N-terminal domain-containing protein, partial [Pirellulales bacterium]|nr:SurA N-terminal domain-containing protein [Pirellulales bacterium]